MNFSLNFPKSGLKTFNLMIKKQKLLMLLADQAIFSIFFKKKVI